MTEQTSNQLLNYKKLGSGQPVFVLHGLFGMLDNWMRIGKWLSEDYCVFLIDQRNHGRSPHLDRHNYELMAHDLVELMDDLDIRSAHMMGHSMGAKTVMQFAGKYDARLKSAIFVDMSPLQSERGHEHVFDALLAVPIHSISHRQQVKELLKYHIDDEGVVSFLMKNLRRNKEGGYSWKMNLPVIIAEYDKILNAIELDAPYEGPVLSIKGEKSHYVTFEDELALFQLFPNIEYESIEDAGHWVHADAPEEFYSALRRFLKKL